VEEARAMGVPMILSDLDVHREQMGDRATYFDRHSAQSLADALDNYDPPDESQRLEMIATARREASRRVTRFGDEFAQLVESCVRQACSL
jgi:hypothetical protein